MIQKSTILRPADNCGVYRVRVFHVYKGAMGKHGFIGDFTKVSAKLVKPENPIKKKSKHRSIIIRTKFKSSKKDLSYICFKKNALVLLKKRLTPKGKTLRGPISRNIRRQKFLSSFSKSI